MRTSKETFDDGRSTVSTYDDNNRLTLMETRNSDDELLVSIEYRYDDKGVNRERIVRSGGGAELRRLHFDESGQEIPDEDAGPVRWASMDGSESGEDERGQEDITR